LDRQYFIITSLKINYTVQILARIYLRSLCTCMDLDLGGRGNGGMVEIA
jgi:hypothetical protein